MYRVVHPFRICRCARKGCVKDMKLRPYHPDDCPALAALFYDTVHTVNCRDYTADQCDAWADGMVDVAAWNRSFLEHTTYVAEQNGQIVGFGDISRDGYLDRLYVHARFQRQGIATALCDALESAVKGRPIETHASITTRPFFTARGYRTITEQQVVRRGVKLTNFVMRKP